MLANVKMNGREKYALVSTRPAVVDTSERPTKATARLYIGLGTVPRHDAIEMPRPTAPPTLSIAIMGHIETPPTSGTVQKRAVPYTRYDAANIAMPKARMSEKSTDRWNLRPMDP
jgi:hypothetical protein